MGCKSLPVILLVFFFLTVPCRADETRRVFDEDWNVKEYWREKEDVIEIYDSHWKRKGFIMKKGDRWELYDRNWRRKGFIEPFREDKPSGD